MSDVLAVVLQDVVAGELVRLPRGRLRFDYRPDYQRQAATCQTLHTGRFSYSGARDA